jgi:hypothetical protein
MKKVFTLCLGLMSMLALHAQSNFPIQFADKDGNIIADGTTLTITDYEEDEFTGVLLPSGLYVKNITESEVQCAGAFTIASMSNGAFQSCFPVNCMQASAVGDYTTLDGPLAAGALKSMQTEWLPTAEGSCSVTYQLVTYKKNPITQKWTKDQEGPAVTLNFNYSTTGLQLSEDIQEISYFDALGRSVSAPTRGVFIQKTTYSDGRSIVRKIKK